MQRGAILIDGIDIGEAGQKDVGRHVGRVLRDACIFCGSIASNMRLHEEGSSEEGMRQAAEYVKAAHCIERLPDGYDEGVRERGAGLCVGEKQLLAFARAVAFNAEILRCAQDDRQEATWSVDRETEVFMQDARSSPR